MSGKRVLKIAADIVLSAVRLLTAEQIRRRAYITWAV